VLDIIEEEVSHVASKNTVSDYYHNYLLDLEQLVTKEVEWWNKSREVLDDSIYEEIIGDFEGIYTERIRSDSKGLLEQWEKLIHEFNRGLKRSAEIRERAETREEIAWQAEKNFAELARYERPSTVSEEEWAKKVHERLTVCAGTSEQKRLFTEEILQSLTYDRPSFLPSDVTAALRKTTKTRPTIRSLT